MAYQRRRPARVKAMFDSHCDDCGDQIVEGEDIGFDEDSEEWLHYDCLEQLLTLD